MESQTNNVRLASWNLCLGLTNKKDLVSKIILENKIDICAMQEIDLPTGYNVDILSFKGYELITENNDVKNENRSVHKEWNKLHKTKRIGRPQQWIGNY